MTELMQGVANLSSSRLFGEARPVRFRVQHRTRLSTSFPPARFLVCLRNFHIDNSSSARTTHWIGDCQIAMRSPPRIIDARAVYESYLKNLCTTPTQTCTLRHREPSVLGQWKDPGKKKGG
jgi:alpha-ketoglutarate-dependent taurine dioxygenase